MTKYTVVASFKDLEANRVRQVGEEIETDDERGEELVKRHVVKAAKTVINSTPDDNGIIHVGGGYYQLPNGEKVKGKEQALEALAALQTVDNEPTSGSEQGSNDSNTES